MKIFLYYSPVNELKRFFDKVRAKGTMLATMLDSAPNTFDSSFSDQKTFSNSAEFETTDPRNKDVKSFNLTKQFYDN